MKQVQLFSKDHRPKKPSLFLGSVVCGGWGMKSKVSLKTYMGGQRKILKWGPNWALGASKTKPLHLASSSLCPGPPFLYSPPVRTLVVCPPVTDWWHVFDPKPSGAHLVTSLNSERVVRGHEFL